MVLRTVFVAGAGAATALTSVSATADTASAGAPIEIGQTYPYSGPASGLATEAKTDVAYMKMINAAGGINGRPINLTSLDDGFSPPKTVELTRRLIEQDKVSMLFGTLGSATNSAILRLLNQNHVPNLFITVSGNKFTDPKLSPWTVIFPPSSRVEAGAFAKYILATMPDAKIGILYQDDDFGRDNVADFKTVLGPKASQIVAEASYIVSDPTVDSQIVTLQASGATVLADFSYPKQTAQAIRKSHELGWKPTHFVIAPSASINYVIKAAGLDAGQGVISMRYTKDPASPDLAGDPDVRDYLAFMKQWYPDGDPTDPNNVTAYCESELLVHVLKEAGSDLSPDNLMRHASSLHDLEVPMLIAGLKFTTTAEDHGGIHRLQPSKVEGERWVPIGELIDGAD
jgi:ABC-type branched-subunit amino acid transport system substrate-binding protein